MVDRVAVERATPRVAAVDHAARTRVRAVDHPRVVASPGNVVRSVVRPDPLDQLFDEERPTRIRRSTSDSLVQREVVEDFRPYSPAGAPPATADELGASRAFAKIVSDFADQARDELLRGDLGDWGAAGPFNAKGARYLAFRQLLERDASFAVTHAGNVIEERVYQLMQRRGMPMAWESQMISNTSRPDVVFQISDRRAGVVDITSEFAHVVKKPGLWSNGSYVFISEALYDSVTGPLLRNAVAAIVSGSPMGVDEFARLEGSVAEARALKAAAKQELAAQVRKEFKDAGGTMKKFSDARFEGSVAKASQYLHAAGVRVKGMRVAKPRGGGGDSLDRVNNAKKRAIAAKKQRSLKATRDVTRGRQIAANARAAGLDAHDVDIEDDFEDRADGNMADAVVIDDPAYDFGLPDPATIDDG